MILMLDRGTIFLGLMLTGTLAAASLVSGDGGAMDVAEAVSAPRDNASQASERPLLQLGRLVRDGVDAPERDPFTSKTWYVPPPPPPPPPPTPAVIQEAARPMAPSLPFKFIAWMREEDGHEIAYLADGNRVILANKGDTLDGIYRVNSIAPRQIDLVYLPLDVHQTLAAEGEGNMGDAPQAASVGALSLMRPTGSNNIAGNVP